MCSTCHTEFVATSQSSPSEPNGEHVISPEEQRFWERMTFREFAILIVRLQAVWLLIDAAMYATYLPSYFTRARGTLSYSPLYTQISFPLFMAILRVIVHVAAAVALIQYAERVLSWLVKDCIPKPPPDTALEPIATVPSDSSKT